MRVGIQTQQTAEDLLRRQLNSGTTGLLSPGVPEAMCFDFFFLPEVCFADFILNEFMLKIRQRYLRSVGLRLETEFADSKKKNKS